jgi:hypothetical protein
MQTLILAFLLSLPVSYDDPRSVEKTAQLEVIARAISDASPTPEAAAMLIATGYLESHFSLRIHLGQCKPYECDGGKARGPWQVQRNRMLLDEWDRMTGLENIEVQARAAQTRLGAGLSWCEGSAYGALAIFLGLPCSDRSWRVAPRFELYERALNALRVSPTCRPPALVRRSGGGQNRASDLSGKSARLGELRSPGRTSPRS